jgi:hypothetical protein
MKKSRVFVDGAFIGLIDNSPWSGRHALTG